MAFKLTQDGSGDVPVLACDVCGERIWDIFGDLASATRVNGKLGNIVIHHKACLTDEQLHMTLIVFFRLFATKNRIGDVASDGVTERTTLEIPFGEGFTQ